MVDKYITIPRERLEALEAAKAERDALQARIDALMLEYCPEEMTEEQLKTWKENQRVLKNEPNK
jgi:hypothetical protein